MRVIILTQGQHTVVDDAVYEWASKLKWFARKNGNGWYAVRNIRLLNGKQKTIYLHREILNAPAGVEVDHRDCDGLNNLGDNIRLCTRAENCCNCRKSRDNTSGFRGVSFDKLAGKWRARINRTRLGRFATALEAAHVRDKAAIELHGEFARLNFPKEAACA